MASTVRQVDYFYVEAPNRPGEAARLLGQLTEAGVNLLAFTGFPTRGRRSQIDFVPDDPRAFRRVARAAKWKLTGPKRAFLIEGDDRAGVLAGIMSRLAEAKINVTAVDAACAGKERYGAILWVKPADVRRAAKALRAK